MCLRCTNATAATSRDTWDNDDLLLAVLRDVAWGVCDEPEVRLVERTATGWIVEVTDVWWVESEDRKASFERIADRFVLEKDDPRNIFDYFQDVLLDAYLPTEDDDKPAVLS